MFERLKCFPGVLIDPDSQEIAFSKAAQAAKPPSKRRTATDEMIRRWAQERGSRERSDPDSEEDPSPSGAQALCPDRAAEPASDPDDESRDLQDPDSLEDKCGRPAPAGNLRDAAYHGPGLLMEGFPTGSEQINDLGSPLQKAGTWRSQRGLQRVSRGTL